MTMKTIPALSLLAALVALYVLPFRWEITGFCFVAAGLLAIAFGDYQRRAAVSLRAVVRVAEKLPYAA